MICAAPEAEGRREEEGEGMVGDWVGMGGGGGDGGCEGGWLIIVDAVLFEARDRMRFTVVRGRNVCV